jgi:hypothetical protein
VGVGDGIGRRIASRAARCAVAGRDGTARRVMAAPSALHATMPMCLILQALPVDSQAAVRLSEAIL